MFSKKTETKTEEQLVDELLEGNFEINYHWLKLNEALSFKKYEVFKLVIKPSSSKKIMILDNDR